MEKRTCSSEGEVNSTFGRMERTDIAVEGTRNGGAMVVVVVVVGWVICRSEGFIILWRTSLSPLSRRLQSTVGVLLASGSHQGCR